MKISELSWNTDDIITQDRFLDFSNENNICYIKTDYFYFGHVNWRGKTHPEKVSKVTFIGHSDFPVTDQISQNFDLIFCINKWGQSENTFGIPLGITNDCDDSPIHRIYGNQEIMYSVFNEAISKNSLTYINFNIDNFRDERSLIYNLFNTKSWNKTGRIDNTLDGRKNYLREIRSSKFVFCPRGNGVDTHRLWESLYMGSIPIVKYENTHSEFTDLPILFISDWREVNEEFLNIKYEEFIHKDWNLSKLKMNFWKEFILQKLKNKNLI